MEIVSFQALDARVNGYLQDDYDTLAAHKVRPALRGKMHLWDRVTADFPPTFLWHGGEDTSVPPENSLLLAVELKRHKVPFEYHLFGSGAHGISTCTQEVETPDQVCRAWVSLCKAWLNRQFGYTP